ncbi:MAG: glycosyltransferase [Thermoflavifilum sp.]|nr:glycosyltransferase [Thermoflavifilum sp.]
MRPDPSSFTRTPQQPPPIPPVQATPFRWSVMIPVYNCASYLAQTLESVLIQALPPDEMQIEVLDDASTDADVEKLVFEIGKGRVHYFRQPQNVGSLHNFNTALCRAMGEYVHLLHGDDVVLPGFYKEIAQLFQCFPEAGMAFCRYLYLDEAGKVLYPAELEAEKPGLLSHWLERLAARQRVQTPAVVVKRRLYEQLGGFYGVHYGEDWMMWIRIAQQFPVAYSPVLRAAYRRHIHSISGRTARSGADMRDIRYVIRWMKRGAGLPAALYRRTMPQARRFYAHYALQTAHQLWHQRAGIRATLAQLRQACLLHPGSLLHAYAWKLYVKILCQLH